MSGLDHGLEPEVEVRRFEVINGAQWRRRLKADHRARIVEETLVLGAVFSAVTRRYGLTPQQLFTWRREARKGSETVPAFVPVMVVLEPISASEPSGPKSRTKRHGRHRRASGIEGDVAGVKETIENEASPATITAVIGALKAGS